MNPQQEEKEKKRGLEENFEALGQIVEQLEREDISLEEAFEVYSRGMELLKECNSQIDRVEKEVLKLGQEA
nr:exodeoxyribonuclease VII small subunit [uncultured Acetatifactor sp.]